jgi:hypothetical protein
MLKIVMNALMLSVLCWGQWCYDIQDNDTQHNKENERISIMYHNMLWIIVMSVMKLSIYMLMSVVP